MGNSPLDRLRAQSGDDAAPPTVAFPPVSGAHLTSSPPSSAQLPASRSQSSLLITVTYAATIFEGEATEYRYDLPASAVESAAGCEKVARQAVGMVGKGGHVRVEAQPALIRLLSDALRAHGLTVHNDGADEDASAAPKAPQPSIAELRHTVRERAPQPRHRAPSKVTPFHVIVGMVVVGVVGVGLWAGGRTENTAVTADHPIAAATSSAPQPPSSATTAPTATSTAPPAPTLVPHTAGLVELSLPEGYEITNTSDDGLVTFTGNDPDFRIVVVADYEPGQDLSPAGIQTRVERDHEIASRPGVNPVANKDVVSYVENPGDGSSAHWYVWGEGEHKISVACHYRFGVIAAREKDCVEAISTATLVKTPTP